jgi:hypothetical protein
LAGPAFWKKLSADLRAAKQVTISEDDIDDDAAFSRGSESLSIKQDHIVAQQLIEAQSRKRMKVNVS